MTYIDERASAHLYTGRLGASIAAPTKNAGHGWSMMIDAAMKPSPSQPTNPAAIPINQYIEAPNG